MTAIMSHFKQKIEFNVHMRLDDSATPAAPVFLSLASHSHAISLSQSSSNCNTQIDSYLSAYA